MEKFKKIAFIVFLSGTLAAAIWAYIRIKKLKSPKIEAITVLPDSCNIYFNISNFNEISEKISAQNLIIDKLRSFNQINEACVLLKSFDSIFNNNEILKEELNGKIFHFAFYNHCKDWLMAFNTRQTGTDDLLLGQLNSSSKAELKNTETHVFKFNDKQFVYFSVSNDIICISNSGKLIKKTENSAEPKFYKSNDFEYFKNNLRENNLCNIYINTKIEKHGAKHGIRSYFFDETQLSGNLVLEPSEIKLNGNLKVDSSHVLSAFSNEEAQPTELFIEALPGNLIYLEAYGFSTYKNIKTKLKKFYPEILNSFWKEKTEKALYNIENEFYENINGEVFLFETSTCPTSYATCLVKDSLKALEHLKIMFDSSHLYKGRLIFKFSSPSSQKLFYPLFSNSIRCAVQKNNQIYFGENAEQLMQLLDQFENNMSVESNQNFVAYKSENFPNNFNYMVYASPRMHAKAIDSFLGFSQTGHFSPYDNLKHFSFTLANGKNGFDFRMQLFNQAENKANEQNALWTLNLDTVLKRPVFEFVNHITDENEIVFQDEKNNLYLVNARGGKLWKRIIEEKIISPIYMVDVFKNEKFQLLFNTEQFLYMVDRNGKDVKGFPVKLPAKATSPLSLLDYNQDKNYRIFIACENNLIYNFNEHGLPQEGFVPVKVEKCVKLPVQYFKVASNEYLVALDVEGKIYTFGRKGQSKIILKNRAIQDCKAFYLNATNNLTSSSLIYYDDKNSLINKVNFNDKKDVVKLDIESNAANISFALVDDNREPDIVINQDKKLYVYNLNGELLYEFKSNRGIDQSLFYGDETNSFYCMLNAANGELEVNNAKAQKSKVIKAENLPLLLNLFNDGKIYMILNYANQLSCVELN